MNATNTQPKRIGYAVATRTAGILISGILPTLDDAETMARRLGCASYLAVEVRS